MLKAGRAISTRRNSRHAAGMANGKYFGDSSKTSRQAALREKALGSENGETGRAAGASA